MHVFGEGCYESWIFMTALFVLLLEYFILLHIYAIFLLFFPFCTHASVAAVIYFVEEVENKKIKVYFHISWSIYIYIMCMNITHSLFLLSSTSSSTSSLPTPSSTPFSLSTPSSLSSILLSLSSPSSQSPLPPPPPPPPLSLQIQVHYAQPVYKPNLALTDNEQLTAD